MGRAYTTKGLVSLMGWAYARMDGWIDENASPLK